MSTYAWPTSKPSTSELRHDQDGALVRQRLRGSDEAFAVFYRRYHKRLLGYCIRRTQNETLAEDLVHDTLIRALEHLDEFDTDRPAWPWLKTIAHNAIIDHARKHGREDLTEQPIAEDELVEDDLTEVLAERPLLAEALSELPERQQVAVRLRYVESWKSSEAGKFLDVSRPAFEQLLFRARTNLRDSYERLCEDTDIRLAGLLVPVFRFKESLTTRIRSRFAGWEQSLQAMGPAAFEAVGQAAATIALLGLAAAAVAAGNSPASADVAVAVMNPTPASSLAPFFEPPEASSASAESPDVPGGTEATESAAPTSTRRVEFDAPTNNETRDVAVMGGDVASQDSPEEIRIERSVDVTAGGITVQHQGEAWLPCPDGHTVLSHTCGAARTAMDLVP